MNVKRWKRTFLAVGLTLSMAAPSMVYAVEGQENVTITEQGPETPSVTPPETTPEPTPEVTPEATPQPAPSVTPQPGEQPAEPTTEPTQNPVEQPGKEDATPTPTPEIIERPVDASVYQPYNPGKDVVMISNLPDGVRETTEDTDPRAYYRRVNQVAGIVTAEAQVDVKEGMSSDRKTVGTLQPGDLLYLLDICEDGWCYIESGDVRGFIPRDCFSVARAAEQIIEETGEEEMPVAQQTVRIRENGAFTYEKITAYEIGEQEGSAMVDLAKVYIGTDYVEGSDNIHDGLDDLHFVYRVVKKSGYYDRECPEREDWSSLGQRVSSMEDALPGDLLIYEDHMGIYDGEGHVITTTADTGEVVDYVECDTPSIIAIRRFAQCVKPLSGYSNAEKIFTYLVSMGWTKEAAAGVIGNMYQESGGGGSTDINPASHGSGGRGISGFTYSPDSRSNDDGNGLVRYANSKGTSWTDLKTQCDYMILCLQGNWGNMWNTGSITGNQLRSIGYYVPNVSFEQFTQLTNVDEAALAFLSAYENCGIANAMTKNRLTAARLTLEAFG